MISRVRQEPGGSPGAPATLAEHRGRDAHNYIMIIGGAHPSLGKALLSTGGHLSAADMHQGDF